MDAREQVVGRLASQIAILLQVGGSSKKRLATYCAIKHD